jgi:hypothetical protein
MYWWNKDGDLAGDIFSKYRDLSNRQAYRQQDFTNYRALYEGSMSDGMKIGSYARRRGNGTLTFNLVQSIIDTKTAKIAKNKPRATFITDDGSYEMQKQAKLLDEFVYGCMYNDSLYTKGPRIFKDDQIFGIGILKFYTKNGKVCSERVFPNEIQVDDDDAIYGTPKTLYQTKYVAKDTLKGMYPKHKDIIDKSKIQNTSFSLSQHDADMVEVIEAWRLPAGDKKGVHVICVDQGDLLREDWELDRFPFVFFKSTEKVLGFWGQGAAERLQGMQLELNSTYETIQKSMARVVPTIYIDRQSKIVKTHLNNQVGNIIEFEGRPPINGPLMDAPVQLFQYADSLIDKAYEQEGISQMSASSKNPLGANASGRAIRTYNDIESERFIIEGQRYEEFFMECARMYIRLSEHLAKKDPSYAVTALTKKGMKRIKWSEIRIDEDQYVMKIYPTNLFSSTPSARLEEVTEMTQAGFFSPEEALMLLEFPDVKKVTSVKAASIEDILETVDFMVDTGEYIPPERYQDLALGMRICQSSLLKYKRQNVPQDNLDLLRRWIDDAEYMLTPQEEALGNSINAASGIDAATLDAIAAGAIPGA